MSGGKGPLPRGRGVRRIAEAIWRTGPLDDATPGPLCSGKSRFGEKVKKNREWRRL